jgi:hypothetical protein
MQQATFCMSPSATYTVKVMGSLLVQEQGLDYASGEPDSWPNLGVFRGLSKPVSSDSNPHIPTQQTTDYTQVCGTANQRGSRKLFRFIAYSFEIHPECFLSRGSPDHSWRVELAPRS